MGQRKNFFGFALTIGSLGIGLLTLLFILAGCGAPSPEPITSGPATISAPTPTFTPPFRALANEPSPTATVERVALIPTSTPPPATRTVKASPTATSAPSVLPYTPPPTFGLYYYPTPDITYSPVLSNGTQIAYVQDGNLWAIDDDGSNSRRLTQSGDINTNGALTVDLIWNNQGDRVAYVSKKNELVIVGLGPGAGAPLFLKSSAENMLPTQPAWSPDGRALAFTIRPKELAAYAAGEVWLVDFQGSKPTLQKLASGFAPAWSPDGKYLAYLSRIGEGEAEAATTPTPAFAVPTPAGTSLLPPTAMATPAPPAAGSNALMLYTFGTKRSRALFLSSDIKDVPSLDWKTSYSVQSSVLQMLWWSPDSRYIAFADQNSYLGVANAGGGSPVMWAGEPNTFAVRQLNWFPGSNGVIFNWNNPGGDDKTFLALINDLGGAPKTSEPRPNPLTSKGRLSVLPSEHALCPALSPSGDLIAYTDSKLQALLIVRLDWTIYSLLPGGDCPRWSWNGRYLATTLRDGENMLATLTPELGNLRPLNQAKNAVGIYWPRPQQLPIDLSALTPAAANPPAPGVVGIKPDQISPPPSGSPVRGITPAAGSPTRSAPRTPTPTAKR